MQPSINSNDEGYWREPSDKIAKGGALTWTAPGKTGLQNWTGSIDGSVVATVRKTPGHVGTTCSASLAGWMWINIPKDVNLLNVKESPARGFASVALAKATVARAVNLLQQRGPSEGSFLAPASPEIRLSAAMDLLREVSRNFTREDDLPDGLLGRIDEFLDGPKA